DLVNVFLERCKIEFRHSTYVGHKLGLEKWINPEWNSKFIDEITRGDVHQMVHGHIKNVSGYRRLGLLKTIKRVFNTAIEQGMLDRNPAIGVKVKVGETVQSALNGKEIDILLREAKSINHRFY